MRSLAWATSLAILLGAGGARAQAPVLHPDGQCAPEVTEHRSAELVNGGISGVWFRHEVIACMMERLATLPLYIQRVQLLEERLQLDEHRDTLLRRQVELAEQEAEQATTALTAAERQAREGREEAQQERDLRWLWFGLGVAVIVIVEGLALWAFSQLHI